METQRAPGAVRVPVLDVSSHLVSSRLTLALFRSCILRLCLRGHVRMDENKQAAATTA